MFRMTTFSAQISPREIRKRHSGQLEGIVIFAAQFGHYTGLGGPVEKRRCRARTPRPVGTSLAHREREASWSAERQLRFGCPSGQSERQTGQSSVMRSLR